MEQIFHDCVVTKAEQADLEAILALQYLAYQREALALGNFEIQPLKQTLTEVKGEFDKGIFLKAVNTGNEIIGSVRGYTDHRTLFIGKLMVHPKEQGKGIGTRLLAAMEAAAPDFRYELFTSSRSQRNLQLYQRQGYVPFRKEPISPELTLIYLEKS